MASKDYFDRIAGQWDDIRKGLYSESVREKALCAAGVKEGGTAADIGGGSGFIAEGLVAKGLKVIAVDQSEAMLAEMRGKFANVEGIEYRVGQAEELPIDDAAVDYAFANMFLHHVESPPVAIGEMTRTLKPGGKLVVTDIDKHEYEFLREEHNDRWMGFDRGDVARWFEEAGLRNVVVDCAEETCCGTSSCGAEQATIGIFVALGEK